jgi:PAP2 superfamily
MSEPTSTLEPPDEVDAATEDADALRASPAQRASNRRQQLLMLAGMAAIVALISFSRLYLGVHYLSDVLGALTRERRGSGSRSLSD